MKKGRTKGVNNERITGYHQLQLRTMFTVHATIKIIESRLLSRLVNDQTAIVVAVLVRTPPLREEMAVSRSTEDSEGEDEYHYLRTSIKS